MRWCSRKSDSIALMCCVEFLEELVGERFFVEGFVAKRSDCDGGPRFQYAKVELRETFCRCSVALAGTKAKTADQQARQGRSIVLRSSAQTRVNNVDLPPFSRSKV